MNPIHNHDRDEDIEVDALLKQSFDGPIPDDGFSDHVMQQLPPRRRKTAWPLAAGVLVGAVLCALSLFTSPLWHAAWHGWLAGKWSASTLIILATMAGMSLLALSWSLAEADDH